MSNQIQKQVLDQMAREDALHLYAEALDRADFDVMTKVLEIACWDAKLSDMITDYHQVLDEAEQEQDAAFQSSHFVDNSTKLHPSTKNTATLNRGGKRGGH